MNLLIFPKQIIENVVGNDREDDHEDDSTTIEPILCQKALKAIMTLTISSCNTRMPTALQKVMR